MKGRIHLIMSSPIWNNSSSSQYVASGRLLRQEVNFGVQALFLFHSNNTFALYAFCYRIMNQASLLASNEKVCIMYLSVTNFVTKLVTQNWDYVPSSCDSINKLICAFPIVQYEIYGWTWEFHAVLILSFHCHSLCTRDVQRKVSIVRALHYSWRVQQFPHISCVANGKRYHIHYILGVTCLGQII